MGLMHTSWFLATRLYQNVIYPQQNCYKVLLKWYYCPFNAGEIKLLENHLQPNWLDCMCHDWINHQPLYTFSHSSNWSKVDSGLNGQNQLSHQSQMLKCIPRLWQWTRQQIFILCQNLRHTPIHVYHY